MLTLVMRRWCGRIVEVVALSTFVVEMVVAVSRW